MSIKSRLDKLEAKDRERKATMETTRVLSDGEQGFAGAPTNSLQGCLVMWLVEKAYRHGELTVYQAYSTLTEAGMPDEEAFAWFEERHLAGIEKAKAGLRALEDTFGPSDPAGEPTTWYPDVSGVVYASRQWAEEHSIEVGGKLRLLTEEQAFLIETGNKLPPSTPQQILDFVRDHGQTTQRDIDPVLTVDDRIETVT